MLRIVRVRYKILYVLGWPVLSLLGGLVGMRFFNPIFSVITGMITSLLFLIVGVRVFRGRDEDVRPPRPWWQMTSRPAAGFILGTVFALSFFVFLGEFLSHRTGRFVDVLSFGLTWPIDLVLVFLFFNSSVRLILLRSAGRSKEGTCGQHRDRNRGDCSRFS